MAPYNQADDIEALPHAVAQLFRLAVPGLTPVTLSRAGAAAGLSASEAAELLDGLLVLPARQSVALVNAFLEEARVRQPSYLTSMRQPHGRVLRAGTNLTQAAADAAAAAEERDAEPERPRRLRRAQ